MKKLMSLLFAVAMVFVLGVPSFSQGFSADNKPTPIFCDSASVDTVTVTGGAQLIGTALSANPARLDGYVINTSTNYLKCTFETTSSTGTTIQDMSDYFLLYPAADAYGRDRIYLKHEGNVFRGPMYFTGLELDLATKGVGSVSVWEWK